MNLKGLARVDWQSNAVTDLIKSITKEQESATADSLLRYARRKVPIGQYGKYRYAKKRVPDLPFSRSRRSSGGFKKGWQFRFAGQLLHSLLKIKSKFSEGGFMVWAGTEKLVYYAHFIEFGTVFFKKKRRGYKFLRSAVNMENRKFIKNLQNIFRD